MPGVEATLGSLCGVPGVGRWVGSGLRGRRCDFLFGFTFFQGLNTVSKRSLYRFKKIKKGFRVLYCFEQITKQLLQGVQGFRRFLTAH